MRGTPIPSSFVFLLAALWAACSIAPAFVTSGFPSVSRQGFLGTQENSQVSAFPSQKDVGGVLSSQQVRPTAWCALAAGALIGSYLAISARRRAESRAPLGLTALRAEAVRQLRPRDRSDGHGWVKEDPEFNAEDESLIIATHSVELKKRPSGIKRYTHGVDGKGAMVIDMHEKGRYPGDPWGQAATAGVKKKFVVKTVNGTDVRRWDFEDIMDLLEDFIPDPDAQSAAAFGNKASRARQHDKVEFPVTIEYMEMKESAATSSASAGPAAPEGAWMPRLKGWDKSELDQERLRVASMPEPGADYRGPRYPGAATVGDEFIKTLMEFQKSGGILPKKDAYTMVLDMIELLQKETTLVNLSVTAGQQLTVFGDWHGQYFDLCNALSLSGIPSANSLFLFNGDFVDRGSWSIEVILLLFAFKLARPGGVFFNRGNHEMLETNIIYGFAGECGTKYDMGIFDLFSESFRNLPLLHLINNEVLVVHAGLPGPMPRVWLPGQTHDPEDAVPLNMRARTLKEIAEVDRYTELTANSFKTAVDDAPKNEEKWETDTRMIVDFLWADPRGGAGYGPSYRKSRGIFMFGPDVTDQFCRENNLKLIIRSHEVKSDGYKYDHSTLMSVFSAPNYLDTGGNKGAFLQLTTGPNGSLAVKPVTYDKVPHPDIPPMFYQEYVAENMPYLTKTMRKKKVDMTADEYGDSDFAGFQGPDEWEEVEEGMPA